jgi:hypothetical protein
MKLVLRLEHGWSSPVEYLGGKAGIVRNGRCPECFAELWIAPHGGVYCDETHDACPNCGKEWCECAD